MAIQNNIITSPVHLVANVARILQTSEKRASALCRHPRINKWAKYKPVNYPKYIPENQEQWTGNLGSTIWGMKVDILDGLREVDDLYEDGTFDHFNWEWDAPFGGDKSPWRILDFLGYYHFAEPITLESFLKGQNDTEYISTSMTASRVYRFSVYSSNHPNAVKLSDVQSLSAEKSGRRLVLMTTIYYGNNSRRVVNNNVPLNTPGIAEDALEEGYAGTNEEGRQYRHVDVVFNKTEMNTGVEIYLSLAIIYYDSGQWIAENIIALPYTDERYYKKQIKFASFVRSVQLTEIYHGVDGNYNRIWKSYSEPVRLSNNGGLRVKMMISKAVNEPLTFVRDNYSTCLMTKYKKSDGSVVTQRWNLANETGDNYPQDFHVDVPSWQKGETEYVYAYFDTGNIFQESFVSGYYPSGVYSAELFLIKNGAETKVGEIFITTK